MSIRRRRHFLIVAAIGVAVFAVLTWRWMLAPASSPAAAAGPADAVVVFDGGQGERLSTALELMQNGAAPVLVISNGTRSASAETEMLCRPASTPQDFEVLCPSPDPNTTQGEGRMFGALAAEQGWDQLIAVTSTYHVTRASSALNQCFDGEITRVSAGTHNRRDLPRLLTREWLATANSRVLARGC